MKDLDTRIADREKREEEAKELAKRNGEINTQGTMAEGKDTTDSSNEDSEYQSKTVAELKEDLDGRGVEYTASAKKAELVGLLQDDDNA